MTETTLLPIDLFLMTGSASQLGPRNLTVLAMFDPIFPRDQRGLALTGFLDSFRIATGTGVPLRQMAVALGLALLTAILVGAWLQTVLPYRMGGLNLYYYGYQANATLMFRALEPAARGETETLPSAGTFFGLGVAAAGLLTLLRDRIAGWPLHPLAYALSASWTMSLFWFPCFAAWLVKINLLRYGGMRLFLDARPLFLGFILGESLAAVLWLIICALTGAEAPHLPTIWQ